MLGEHGDHDRRIFGALALVNGRRIGRHQGIKLAKTVGDGAAIEAGNQLAGKAVDIIRAAEAGELPPRIASSPDFYLCRWCAYAQRCWSAPQ